MGTLPRGGDAYTVTATGGGDNQTSGGSFKIVGDTENWDNAIALNNRSSSYYYVLAGLYRRLGRSAESRKALESFTRFDRENNDLEKMRRNMAMPKAERPGGGRE